MPEALDLGEIPQPTEFTYDAHFGYSPTPSPPPEIANQLTKEQIEMGMYKVESGQGQLQGTMGPPTLPQEEVTDKNRGARTKLPTVPPPPSRKRKDRENDVEAGSGSTARKKSRGH